MSIALRQRLNELASSFAAQVLEAIRGASLGDLLSGSTDEPSATPRGPKRSARLPRRTDRDIAKIIDRIVPLLKQNPNGLRAEQIRDELSLQAKELPRPLREAVDSGRVSKSGKKRATTYFAKGAGARTQASPARPAGGANKGAGGERRASKRQKRGDARSRAAMAGGQGRVRGSGGAPRSVVGHRRVRAEDQRKGGRGERPRRVALGDDHRPAVVGEDRPADKPPAPSSSVATESAPQP